MPITDSWYTAVRHNHWHLYLYRLHGLSVNYFCDFLTAFWILFCSTICLFQVNLFINFYSTVLLIRWAFNQGRYNNSRNGMAEQNKYKKLIRRWDSECELSLRRHCTRTKNTIDTCINSATDRFLQCRFTKFSEVTQCNGHYAVQGHSRSTLLVPIESSYTTSY